MKPFLRRHNNSVINLHNSVMPEAFTFEFFLASFGFHSMENQQNFAFRAILLKGFDIGIMYA